MTTTPHPPEHRYQHTTELSGNDTNLGPQEVPVGTTDRTFLGKADGLWAVREDTIDWQFNKHKLFHH